MDLLKSILVFQQVAKHQSFSRAADELNLVPSAVSRQISELEKWLDIRLINRTTRTLNLTDDGHAYLAKMASIMTQVEDLKSTAQKSQHLTGSIKLTAPMMMGQYVLPNALAEFKRQHPHILLSLSLVNRKVDLIEEGFDLALRVGHLSDSSMIARSIGQMQFKTVASPGYLALRGIPNHPKQLSEHNCLIHSAITTPRKWTYQIEGKPQTVKVNGDTESNDSLCLKAFSVADQGITQLPSFYVDKDIANHHLVDILSNFAPAPLPINLLYPSQRLISPAIKALIEFLVDFLRLHSASH